LSDAQEAPGTKSDGTKASTNASTLLNDVAAQLDVQQLPHTVHEQGAAGSSSGLFFGFESPSVQDGGHMRDRSVFSQSADTSVVAECYNLTASAETNQPGISWEQFSPDITNPATHEDDVALQPFSLGSSQCGSVRARECRSPKPKCTPSGTDDGRYLTKQPGDFSSLLTKRRRELERPPYMCPDQQEPKRKDSASLSLGFDFGNGLFSAPSLPETTFEKLPQMNETSGSRPRAATDLNTELQIPESEKAQRVHFVMPPLLRQCKLYRLVREQYAQANLIERADNSIIWSSIDQLITVAPEDDADMCLSPSTGLVITSLQHLSQKAFPGKPGPSLLQKRLLSTAPYYSKLVVLVSLDRPSTTTGEATLLDRDCVALCAFTAFCQSSLFVQRDVDVQVVLASGGHKCLADWIVKLMAEHGQEMVEQSAFRTVMTTQELFLCRIGLNAFAAQYVMETLGSTVHLQDRSEQAVPTLLAFISLSEKQRLIMYEERLGNSLVRRVNEAIHGHVN